MVSRRRFVSSIASIAAVASAHQNGFTSQVKRLTENHAVATVHPLATNAADLVIRNGGNAIDGAIAAALMLGVVDGHNSGLGGGCLGLVRLAEGSIHAVDGRETAPEAAHSDMYIRAGKLDTELSQTGALAVAVPSQLAALYFMHQRWGKQKWATLFEPAIETAQRGFEIGNATAKTIAEQAKQLAKFEASMRVLLHEDGSPRLLGETLVQSDLAATLQSIAKEGPDWFYRGAFADKCVVYIRQQGGNLSRSDFQNYEAKVREPIRTAYRNFNIIGFPPPSSGGLHIAQMLMMLSPFDLNEIQRRSHPDYLHLVTECMRRAFADRAYWLGDSDFVDIPKGLLDQAYAESRMRSFDFDKTIADLKHGLPEGAREIKHPNETSEQRDDAKHTTHLTVADSEGNWVALTNTVNTSWGSKVMVPATGVMLNNQMDDFSISPGTPNAFGLVGSHANAIEPRKRPLSSLSPTIVLNEQGLPVMTCGAAGGPRIINATLQIVLNTLDHRMPIVESVAAPRIHHQWMPNTLFYEPTVLDGTVDSNSSVQQSAATTKQSLIAKGHKLKESSSLAVAQAIQRVGNRLTAAHDPRANGSSIS